MEIGRKVYFDKSNGNVILDTGERCGSVVETSVEEDVSAYRELSERNRETFDVIQLAYGELASDFASATGYRVDVDTKQLVFTYSDVNRPEPVVYQPPLSEQLHQSMQYMIELEFRLCELEMASK